MNGSETVAAAGVFTRDQVSYACEVLTGYPSLTYPLRAELTGLYTAYGKGRVGAVLASYPGPGRVAPAARAA